MVRELCALQEVLEKPIGKLSRGLRQRVGLAQALLHDPEVVIMDEPTMGLDPNQIGQFRENIPNLGSRKTILISTHILQEVDAIVDYVLFVHDGRMVFKGTPAQLSKDGSLEGPFYGLTHVNGSAGAQASGASGKALNAALGSLEGPVPDQVALPRELDVELAEGYRFRAAGTVEKLVTGAIPCFSQALVSPRGIEGLWIPH